MRPLTMLLLGGSAATVGYVIYKQTRSAEGSAASIAGAPTAASLLNTASPTGVATSSSLAGGPAVASFTGTELCPIKCMGEPSVGEEDIYVADLVSAVHRTYDAFAPRYKTSVVKYLQEVAMKDPFWTPENIAKRDFVGEYEIFMAGVDHHQYEWENGTPGTVGRPTSACDLLGHCEWYPDDWFVKETRGFEADYRIWSKNAETVGVFAAPPAPWFAIRAIKA